MPLKSLLMPWISQHLLSEARQSRLRARAEQRRQRAGRGHEVHYFHQADDPYSALTAACLPELVARYGLTLHAHVVGAPADDAVPERERLIAYSRRDAALLARRHGLSFADPGRQPVAAAVDRANAQLLQARAEGRFVEQAGAISQSLWQTAHGDAASGVAPAAAASSAASVALGGSAVPDVQDMRNMQNVPNAPESVLQAMREAAALRTRLGHYLGATFHYAGEWYWGIDRLHHLERRLQALGAQRPGVSGLLFAPPPESTDARPHGAPPPIDFFFSFRSPYSAIVAPRVFQLARRTGAEVRLRFVLPMVMRGLPVPRIKRSYIAMDTAREARVRGIPFGRLNDPVGRPTERGLSLIPWAERQGKGEAWVLSFLHGVWAEGLDAGSDRGLRAMVERAGLDWDAARVALHDDGWRATAEANREAMFALGLWGVPSFQVGALAVWGQDRLWAIDEALCQGGGA